ncbi:hypothetical protein Tco_0231662 [Tanacetum coccineum]
MVNDGQAKVRILQKSQENGQNRTNTDTGMERVHKSRDFLAKGSLGISSSSHQGPNHGLLSNLSKSPREILATKKVARSFKQPPRMLRIKRSRDMSKYCYFHEDHGHDTNDCRKRRSQIEEAVKSGQLSHFVKGIKNEKVKTSDSQQGEKKEKSTTPAEAPILMINQKEACKRNSISKSPTFEGREITCPPITKGSNSSAPVVIKAKIFGREKIRDRSPANTKGVLSCTDVEEKIIVNSKYPEQTITIEKQLPEHFKESTSSRKEVEELTRAGILQEAAHQTWVANPIMVNKSDGGWRMCVDFMDINKACPKDCYPLPEIDWKVESLLGFHQKCFLDAYKGNHQIQMAEEDEDKTTFFAGEGVYCY